ncbi:hypothetical protein [Aquimarina muelleri]|uniref:Uncharacterized protein n=1 Tax=Aquimarina muelleri TaxID=279356 RepID=A0A918N2J3_9FLAO|nr:hypothetical protein [Aquimarina muelleri]MCX2761305.1 hypothetical protein [Aquimarina muelleri]GGX12412.1 hypothetical protein GCM10007384_12760 [Aquimarina muelleri]
MTTSMSNEIKNKIQKSLQEIANPIMNDPDCDNMEEAVAKSINNRMRILSNSLIFNSSYNSDTEIKGASYRHVSNSGGVIKGEIVIEHKQKQNIFKYGGPGYPGTENGQLCEYPKGSRKFYKWNSTFCKWEDLYKDTKRTTTQGQSWHNKLTNNAAFEPWWGNNPGMDGIKSDRKRNGADDMWGDPGVQKFGGPFRQYSKNVMESVYAIVYDFKSMLDHYIKIDDSFRGEEKRSSKQEVVKEINIKEIEDTTTHRLDVNFYKGDSNQHFSGFNKDIKGYKKAQKDSAYHVNRSNTSVKIEVKLTKKYH